ncbi:hypothetical protein [Desulfospira joergensenii]|uniref:hypothetical protein n=1 Tax=Desulfospira joergensenii TaxID=53329 RepID=UPI0003B66EFE|nr:hypothetical protein [Desulfospira joergensenii]
MDKANQDSGFKKGVWIKEQQGMLTMGAIDGPDKEAMIVPDELCTRIFAFEEEMMSALYGSHRVPFNPAIVDIEKLLANLKARFKEVEMKISFSNPQNEEFQGDYEKIFDLIGTLVLSSISQDAKPLIYINASLVQGHLCIIYRDSDSVSDPSQLTKEMKYIRTELKGEASYKKTSEDRSYYDIMIPSKT